MKLTQQKLSSTLPFPTTTRICTTNRKELCTSQFSLRNTRFNNNSEVFSFEKRKKQKIQFIGDNDNADCGRITEKTIFSTRFGKSKCEWTSRLLDVFVCDILLLLSFLVCTHRKLLLRYSRLKLLFRCLRPNPFAFKESKNKQTQSRERYQHEYLSPDRIAALYPIVRTHSSQQYGCWYTRVAHPRSRRSLCRLSQPS